MKRSITAPLVGLGLGATALGGATYVGGSTRCTEGRVVESLAQCQSLVGVTNAPMCATAFGGASMSGGANAAGNAVFLTTRPDGTPTAEPITRAAGDPKWRGSNGSVMEAFRNGCSRSSSRSGSSSSGYRSGWSSWGSGSGVNSGSSTSTVSRGGFGSSAVGFSSS